MVNRILLLADETAHIRIGGLTQLERLLLAIQEYSSMGVNGTSSNPEVSVLWRSEALARAGGGERRAVSFPVHEMGAGEASSVEARRGKGEEKKEKIAVVHTSLVVGRGVFRSLIETALRNGGLSAHFPMAVRSGTLDLLGTGADRWDRLSALVPVPVPVNGSGKNYSGFVDVVVDAGDVPEVERRLFRTLGKASDGYAAKHLNRPLSIRLSRFLSWFPVTPNQWSSFLLLFMCAGAAALMLGTPLGFLAGIVVYQAVSVLDGCDGEIARVKYLDTRSGAWVDTLIDMFGHHLFVIALGIGLSRQPGLTPTWSSIYLWEGFLTAAVMLLTLWGVAYSTGKQGGEGHFREFGKTIIDDSPLSGKIEKLFHVVSQLLRRDCYAILFVVLALMGRSSWVLHLLGVGVATHMVALLYSMRSASRPGRSLAGISRG